MKKLLCALLVAGLGAIGLVACDASPPPKSAVSRPAEPEAVAEPEVVAEPEAVAESAEAKAAREMLAAAIREEDAFARARRLATLLPTLGPEALPAVKQTLDDPTLDLGGTEIELLVRFWAMHEPEDASVWAVRNSPPGYGVPAVLAAVTLWAEADPQAALVANREWPVPRVEVHDAIQRALVRGWFARDPSEAGKNVKTIDQGIGRQRALTAYIRALMQSQGPDAVMRWAESIPDKNATFKTTAYWQVGAALPLFDFAAAVRWCEAHCEGPHGRDLRSIIARRWAQRDGAGALAWLSSAPEGHAKNFSLWVAFSEWGLRDRQAAMAWMKARTTGEPAPWLEPIFPAYAKLLAQDSPAEAMKWLERIEDDRKREVALIYYARQWRKVDEAAAEAWLRQSSLSEEAREKARAPGPPPPPSG